MEDFKVNKKNAALSTAAQAVNSELDTVIGALILAWPQAAIALKFIQSSFGTYVIYKQEKLNQFIEFLIKNPSVFKQTDFSSKEFQEGLFIQLEYYFKLRVEEKRQIAQRIFLKFGNEIDKPSFPLERYNDTLLKISNSGLGFLAFFDKKVNPIREKEINLLAKKHPVRKPSNGEPRSWWIEHYRKSEPISKSVDTWLQQTYQTNSGSDKAQLDAAKQKSEKINELSEAVAELEQLNIMLNYHEGLGQWGGPTTRYKFTSYGLKFYEFITSN